MMDDTEAKPTSGEQSEPADLDEVRCAALCRERLAEAARFRLLGLLFRRPRKGWHEEIAALGAEIEDDALHAAVEAARTANEGDYLALLGPGGLVSPREAAHCGLSDPGRVIADLNGFYEAFAYRPKGEDPPDHLAVESDFVSYLMFKEAYALARREPDPLHTTGRVRRKFVAEHLTQLGAGFKGRLDTIDDAPAYLRMAAELLSSLPERSAKTFLELGMDGQPDEFEPVGDHLMGPSGNGTGNPEKQKP